MKITCDTDIGELIKVSDVTSAYSNLSGDIKPILVYSKVLKQETTTGKGLSKEALNIKGISYANQETIKQLGNLEDFHSSYSASKSTLIDAAEKQRKKELQLLQTAVEAKIDELNSTISTQNAKLNPGPNDPPLDATKKAIIQSQIAANQDALKKYEKKLELVKAELGKV